MFMIVGKDLSARPSAKSTGATLIGGAMKHLIVLLLVTGVSKLASADIVLDGTFTTLTISTEIGNSF